MTIYLLAKYYKIPRDPKQSGVPGYMKDPENFSLDESVKFTRSLQKRDLSEHNVILNIFEQRIEKCNVEEMKELNYEQLFAYFYKNYKNYFDRMFEAIGLKVEMDRVDEQGQIVTDPVLQDAEVQAEPAEVATAEA